MNKTRPKQLSFRVNEEEYQQLQEKVLQSGKNQQEYVLSCVLEKQIVNTDGIKELIPELKRIGNNLNQIAKRCNEGGVLPSEAEVREQGEELKPVSYTHLDVYKRQQQRRKCRLPRNYGRKPGEGHTSTLSRATIRTRKSRRSRHTAVSYTHLDVYKRQLEGQPQIHHIY